MQESKLKEYAGLLSRFNRNFNLHSRSPRFSLPSAFEDCLQGALALKDELARQKGPVLDIGSGNGLPGIVFAILYPETSFVLCERSMKKAEFLRHCLFQLKLFNGDVFCGRAELLERKFPVIVSKGAIPLKNLPDMLKNLLLPGGRAFIYSSTAAFCGAARNYMENSSFSLQIQAVYKLGKGRTEEISRLLGGGSLEESGLKNGKRGKRRWKRQTAGIAEPLLTGLSHKQTAPAASAETERGLPRKQTSGRAQKPALPLPLRESALFKIQRKELL